MTRPKLTLSALLLLAMSSCTTYHPLQVGKTYRTTRNGLLHRAGEFRVDSVYADGRYGMRDLYSGVWVISRGGGIKLVK